MGKALEIYPELFLSIRWEGGLLMTDLDIKFYCDGMETEGQHHFAQGAVCHYEQGLRFYCPVEEERYLCLLGGMMGS
jgi:hypothetical protein